MVRKSLTQEVTSELKPEDERRQEVTELGGAPSRKGVDGKALSIGKAGQAQELIKARAGPLSGEDEMIVLGSWLGQHR